MTLFSTLSEAVNHWVRGFNSIPTNVVRTLRDSLPSDDFELVAGKEFLSEDSDLPSWGTMWTFERMEDEKFFISNLDLIEKCGFVAYWSDRVGLILGIEGGGYDFYEDHWTPLYKARGLQWHEEEKSDTPSMTVDEKDLVDAIGDLIPIHRRILDIFEAKESGSRIEDFINGSLNHYYPYHLSFDEMCVKLLAWREVSRMFFEEGKTVKEIDKAWKA